MKWLYLDLRARTAGRHLRLVHASDGWHDAAQKIKEDYPDVAVILLTAQATIDSAVEAIKVGAYDYLEKPVDPARLRILLDKCLEREKTLKEVQLLKSQLKQYGSFGDMAGNSPQMLEVYRLIEMVAPSTASVLITGESGTGKELVARNIHLQQAQRRALHRHQLFSDS